MPADERIKVIFKRVEVRHDGDWIGAGEWYFRVRVNGVRVGREQTIFSVRDGGTITLPEADWHSIVDVHNLATVPVSFEALDKDVLWDDHMGSVSFPLSSPYSQIFDYPAVRQNFTLIYEVQLSVGGAFGRHPGGAVFCTRRNAAGAGAGPGSMSYTTVSGITNQARMEICPVWPVPPDANMPALPALPAGVAVVRNGAAKAVAVGSDINIIPNPDVIPLLSDPAPAAGPVPALPAGAPPRATPQTAARIECTYYWPDTLAFTDNDPRLEWEALPPANVGFVGRNVGLKVLAYGKVAGDVMLRVKFQGAVFAEFRAVVGRIRQVPFRANILNGPGTSKPRSGPPHVANHIAIANRFLRQAGIELIPDANVTLSNNAVATGNPGIYRINVAVGRTRNVGGSTPISSRLNYRNGVLNIQYIHSLQHDPGWLIFGRSTDRPRSPAHPQTTDNLVPTPSWMIPTAGGGCGVDPAPAPAGAVRMDLLAPSNRPHFNQAGMPTLAAFLITNDCGDPATDVGARMYGNVIAHEFSHVLGLAHRVGAGPDNTGGHPPQQNIMCQGEPPMVRQDFDRIQAVAMRRSPVVPP